MLKGTFPIEKFKKLETPFYYYDIKLLQETLNVNRPKRFWCRLREWRRDQGGARGGIPE